MNHFTRLVHLVIFTLILGSFMSSQAQTSEPLPTSEQAPEIVSRQTFAHDVTVAKLSNGLTIIVQENHSAPVATVRCAVKNTGSINEGIYLGAGLSHVLEHVVAGGSTTKRSEKEIEQLVDTFGGMTNAYTSLDVTAYYIDCPSKNVEMCIELIADAMQHAAFVPEEFDREMGVVQQELADGKENRSRVLWKMAQETIYLESPARVPIIGYLEVLKQVKREQIIDFYRRRYVPNNQIFVVVGDVQTEKVLNQVASLWAGTPRGFENTPVLVPEQAQTSPRTATCEMDGTTTDVLVAFPTVRLQDDDLYALDVLSYILSEGESTRMVRDLRNERNLVFSVGTSSYTPTFERGYFAVKMVCEPQKEREAIEAALEHLYRIKSELVTEKELSKAKKQKAAELIFSRQTVQAEAEGLASSYMSTGTPDYDEVYVEGIQRVTLEQIRDVARKYFVPERLNTVCIRPKAEVAESGEVAEIAENAQNGEVKTFTMDNGVRVLIKRVTNLPLVDVRFYTLGGGLFDTEATAGRVGMVTSMLDRGTPTRSGEEISEFFDSTGGSLHFTSGRYTYSGGVSVLKEDLTPAVEILADCVRNASFPEEKFQQNKILALGSIERRKNSPMSELIELFNDTLPASSPYHINGDGKKETIEPLTAEALRSFYYERMLDPESMIVCVYGDVEESEAEALAWKYFGDLPKNPNHAKLSFDYPNEFPENVATHKVTQKEAGLVLLAYPCPGSFDEKEYVAMKVLNAVMSGVGYPGGWLHTELRGEGLVYSVFGSMRTGVVPGHMIFVAQTRPDSLEDVTQRIFKNVDKAIAGDITPEEFETARAMLLAIIAQSDTTIGEQASSQGLSELYGFGYDFNQKQIALFEAVTLEEVKAVAKKYLGAKHLLVTTSNR